MRVNQKTGEDEKQVHAVVPTACQRNHQMIKARGSVLENGTEMKGHPGKDGNSTHSIQCEDLFRLARYHSCAHHRDVKERRCSIGGARTTGRNFVPVARRIVIPDHGILGRDHASRAPSGKTPEPTWLRFTGGLEQSEARPYGGFRRSFILVGIVLLSSSSELEPRHIAQ
jgi:hypothetical protein